MASCIFWCSKPVTAATELAFDAMMVSAVKAMRLYTDGKCALMAQTMDIEIGGALTDDTPPELSAEAS